MNFKDIKFSLWCDFIERDFLKKDFKNLVETKGINGATSNPSIFKNAITNSKAYVEDIKKLSSSSPKEICEELACQDIKDAATILEPLYKEGNDGYVSIEIDPLLCDDVALSIEEGKRLHKKIGKKNVMIKVPATDAGYEVMQELIADGIPVNITLVFSPLQVKKSLDSIKKAQQKIAVSKEFPQVVISVFVSRFDRKLDKVLEQKNIKPALTGVYNATKIYNMIESQRIVNVRTLFASTGVKGDNLPKDYYIKELLYSNVVNTAPLDTIEAFLDSGDLMPKKPLSNSDIDQYFDILRNQGIDMDKVYNELMKEGVDAFKEAFTQMLDKINVLRNKV